MAIFASSNMSNCAEEVYVSPAVYLRTAGINRRLLAAGNQTLQCMDVVAEEITNSVKRRREVGEGHADRVEKILPVYNTLQLCSNTTAVFFLDRCSCLTALVN